MRRSAVWNRWLGVGLASILAVVTLGLALTGRLALYINPSSNWFAIPMAILLLVGAGLSFLLPLGAEDDHGHDHGTGGGHDHGGHDHPAPRSARARFGATIGIAGGLIASAVMVSVLTLPPAALSAEIAQTRGGSSAPLFAGADVVVLATHGDTKTFGVGDWANVFANATNTDSFEGDDVTLIGFVTPGHGGGYSLTRLVITHCVIDAQTASVPVAATGSIPATGTWVQVVGKVRTTADGRLEIDASATKRIPEPKDPYEY